MAYCALCQSKRRKDRCDTLGDIQIKSAHGLILIEKNSFNAHSLSNLEKGQCFLCNEIA